MKTVMPTIRLLLTAVLLSACSYSAVESDNAVDTNLEKPAVIVNVDAESRADLIKALTAALNGASVSLAEDALSRKDTLIVERKPIKDARGNLIQGRELGVPDRFNLLINDGQCVLVHQNSGQRWRLENTECKAFH